jgi:catechol 2,3-dioxygenase-like lactoylglutathione lyase family enzyme
MAIEFNHTIVWSKDRDSSAAFLAGILGLPEPGTFGPFRVVETGNGVTLDFAHAESEIAPQHYAFLVTEEEFDQIFRRICDKELTYWADPGRSKEGEINTHDGGRGYYFEGPDGHFYEILTRPYGSGGWTP